MPLIISRLHSHNNTLSPITSWEHPESTICRPHKGKPLEKRKSESTNFHPEKSFTLRVRSSATPGGKVLHCSSRAECRRCNVTSIYISIDPSRVRRCSGPFDHIKERNRDKCITPWKRLHHDFFHPPSLLVFPQKGQERWGDRAWDPHRCRESKTHTGESFSRVECITRSAASVAILKHNIPQEGRR